MCLAEQKVLFLIRTLEKPITIFQLFFSFKTTNKNSNAENSVLFDFYSFVSFIIFTGIFASLLMFLF